MLIENINHLTTIASTITVLPTDIEIPAIGVDWDAPFMKPLKVVASWVLTGAIVIVFILLIVAIAAIAGRRIGPERLTAWAGENVLWIGGVAALLGSVGTVFAFFVNFDLGFA